jgi:formylglycine-generating enzyme
MCGSWAVGTALLTTLILLLSPDESSVAEAASPQPGSIFRECAECPEMVVIPTGRFTMRAKTNTDGGHADTPVVSKFATAHEVRVDRAFAAALYDITRDEFAEFARHSGYAGDTGCYLWKKNIFVEDLRRNWRDPGFPQSGRDPVVCVSWADAQAYVAWLNARLPHPQNDGPYRLPTWEEAEYLARGGLETAYYWGPQPSRGHANYGAANCLPCRPQASGGDRWLHTSPVGSFPPNPFGLFDVAGDVWQWTSECWPIVAAPFTCRWKIIHGGSWLDNPEYLQSAQFTSLDVGNHSTTTGFRVVRTIEPGAL